jgi:hypothetical protein
MLLSNTIVGTESQTQMEIEGNATKSYGDGQGG